MMEAENQSYQELGFKTIQLARAYVPFQRFTKNYSPQEALKKGTLYPELWMPYRPGGRGYY